MPFPAPPLSSFPITASWATEPHPVHQPHSPASASPDTHRSCWLGWAPASSGAPAAPPGEAPAAVAAAMGPHTHTAWWPPKSPLARQAPTPPCSLRAQAQCSPQGLAPSVLAGEAVIGKCLFPDRSPCTPNRACPQLAGLGARQRGSGLLQLPGSHPPDGIPSCTFQQWGAPSWVCGQGQQ